MRRCVRSPRRMTVGAQANDAPCLSVAGIAGSWVRTRRAQTAQHRVDALGPGMDRWGRLLGAGGWIDARGADEQPRLAWSDRPVPTRLHPVDSECIASACAERVPNR